MQDKVHITDAQGLFDRYWGQDLSNSLRSQKMTFGKKSFTVKYIPHDIVHEICVALNYKQMNINTPLIIVRKEYRKVYRYMEKNSKVKLFWNGGMVITGQPGIGTFILTPTLEFFERFVATRRQELLSHLRFTSSIERAPPGRHTIQRT